MNIQKTLQQLGAAVEKGSGKQMLLKCREILEDNKSECNPLKMLKAHFSVTLQALILRLCQKIHSTISIFQLIYLHFKNTGFKKNFKGKSNNFEMQCIVCYSRCIALHFQLLQPVCLTDRWSIFCETTMNRQHLLSSAINKKGKGNLGSTVWKYTVESIEHSI